MNLLCYLYRLLYYFTLYIIIINFIEFKLTLIKIILENITLTNSPFWTFHPWNSLYVNVNMVTIINPLHSPNTDGFDPDSTSFMTIENSFVTCGDDGVAIKSGLDCNF